MKLIYYILVVFMFIMLIAEAAGVLVLYTFEEQIEKVLELPQSDEFRIKTTNGLLRHADLGVYHKQFSFFGIPLFNFEPEKYVLYSYTEKETDFIYVELDSEDIAYLQSEFGISSTPKLPFWKAWGGKILLLAIFFILSFFEYAIKSAKANNKTDADDVSSLSDSFT